jgi:hypothetical protein
VHVPDLNVEAAEAKRVVTQLAPHKHTQINTQPNPDLGCFIMTTSLEYNYLFAMVPTTARTSTSTYFVFVYGV